MSEKSVAASVGSGIERRERFRPVAAWAWLWRSFDMELPDVTGAAWRAEPSPATGGETAGSHRREPEPEANAGRTGCGPW